MDVNVIRDCGWSVDKVRFPFSPIGKSYYTKLEAFKVLSLSDSLSSASVVISSTSVPTSHLSLYRSSDYSEPIHNAKSFPAPCAEIVIFNIIFFISNFFFDLYFNIINLYLTSIVIKNHKRIFVILFLLIWYNYLNLILFKF